MKEENPSCKSCGFPLLKDGFKNKIQRYHCKICDRYFSESTLNTSKEPKEFKESYEQGDDFINIVCASERVLSKEDIINRYNIDLNIWHIERFTIKTHEGYRKDRRVKWIVKNGTVTEGNVDDSGKLLIAPLYSVQVKFILKKQEVLLNETKNQIIEEMKKYSPKYPIIKYNKFKDNFLLEPDLPDLHFGKLAWREESGEDWDIKMAEADALKTITSLLNQASVYNISKILFPIGNDYFNVNNKLNITIHNTPQQEDTRWQKTFVAGRKLAIKMIDQLQQIAPVDVVIVPGNHDEERTFYLGDALECWYNKSKSVNIDNRACKRKYYNFGLNLIGFTHGYYEKLDKLPLIMSLEQPELWAKSKFREWQTGDKHHKKEIKISMKENEDEGVMVRVLRALTVNDAWTTDKGFVGANRAGEAFVRHSEKGLVAQLISIL